MKTKSKYALLFCGVVCSSSVAFSNNHFDKIQPRNNITVASKIDDVKPQNIIDQYIQAIGGKQNIDQVKTISSSGSISMQGMSMPYEVKSMNPNKISIVATMNGSIASKQVFDGKKGYKEQMGNKADLTDDEMKPYLDQKGLFPQEYYVSANYILVLKSTDKINDKPAYVIEVTSPSGYKTTEYYDSASHLLVRQDVNQQGINVSTIFSDYRVVNNVLLPFKMTQNIQTPSGDMAMDFITDTYTINGNDVTDADFQ